LRAGLLKRGRSRPQRNVRSSRQRLRLDACMSLSLSGGLSDRRCLSVLTPHRPPPLPLNPLPFPYRLNPPPLNPVAFVDDPYNRHSREDTPLREARMTAEDVEEEEELDGEEKEGDEEGKKDVKV
jgi:hypothetical protein